MSPGQVLAILNAPAETQRERRKGAPELWLALAKQAGGEVVLN